MEALTQERVRELFNYNPETGVMRWRRRSDTGPQWNAKHAGKVAGSKKNHGYLAIGIDGRRYLAHRVIWLREYGYMPIEIDHINGARIDNRLANIRAADRTINNRNLGLPKNNTSGRIGVCWDQRHGKWLAQIEVDNRNRYLGRFVSFEDASAARAAAEREHGYHENHGRRLMCDGVAP